MSTSIASIKIQSFWRGYSARKKSDQAEKHLLSYTLFKKAKTYVDIPSKRQTLPKAATGKTNVYLPKELPIVLKQSFCPGNQKRFVQMKQGREICETSGYQNLVIPKARVYGDFIIESRLPITMPETKEQIGLYIENREKFTQAVKEFIGFVCQSTFVDITGGNDHYNSVSKSPVGRYDNIALYLEKEQGKLGLIDLEHFTPTCEKKRKEWCFLRCRDAIHLFPLHFEEILNTAKKFDPRIEDYLKELELERDEALKLFKLAYEDHLEFIRKKGITSKNPIFIEKLDLKQVEELRAKLEVELQELHEGALFNGILGKNPDSTLTCFSEKCFPQILEAVYNFINSRLKLKLELQDCKGGISSQPQLLSLRTLIIRNIDEFSISSANCLTMLNFEYDFLSKDFCNVLFDFILNNLVNCGNIAYYNPRFGYRNPTRCLFC